MDQPPPASVPASVPSSAPHDPGHDPYDAPEARVRRRRVSLIWLIPLVAAGIAGWLGYRSLSERGPLITIMFQTGSGLTAGQTRVKHKAVDLGTVESVDLTRDLKQVLIRVRMRREATPYLTDQARFWVVRPRLTAGNISGLETLVSGSYIEMDPGQPDGKQQLSYHGLDEPPGVRSDEPGRTYVLKAERIGSLGAGSPVFYRDVAVGEVLGYDPPTLGDPITVHIFVRDPFDKYVHQGTRFWNASGVRVELGGQGLHVELESLQALISGGISFGTPPDAQTMAEAPADSVFPLYPDLPAAITAGLQQRIPFVTYFDQSVSGLLRGTAVQIFGIQVGTVTDVHLQLDTQTGKARVRVAYDVQPERIFGRDAAPPGDPLEVTRRLVEQGMRAQLETASYVTGQMVLSLGFVPNAAPAEPSREGDAIVIPGQAGGLQNILTGVSDVVAKLNNLPLDQLATTLTHTLSSIDQTVSGPELKETLRSVSAAMANVQDLVRKADAGMTPVLRRLPDISAALQETVARASRLVGSADTGYGANSDFRRNLDRTMSQINDAARSIRLLADFLDRHPEALIRGRAGQAGDR